MFVLLSGRASLYHYDDSKLSDADVRKGWDYQKEIDIGGVVGAISSIVARRRFYSVRAISDCTFLCLSLRNFSACPMQFVSDIALQAGKILSSLISDFVSFGLEMTPFQAGQVVFRQKDPVQYLHFVVSGRLRIVSSQAEGVERIVQEVGRGACVGEMAILAGISKHRLSVLALRDTEAVRISKESLDLLIRSYPQVLSRLSQTMASRLLSITRQDFSSFSDDTKGKPRRIHRISLFPLSESVDIASFSHNLESSLRDFGSVKVLDRSFVSTLLEEQGMDFSSSSVLSDSLYRSRVSSIFTDFESSHRFVILIAEYSASAWSESCVHQSDCVLLLANSMEKPDVSPLEKHIIWESSRKMFSRRELLLIHASDVSVPSGTKLWLEKRKVHGYHHVKMHSLQHFHRLARYFAGQAVGLVFGG